MIVLGTTKTTTSPPPPPPPPPPPTAPAFRSSTDAFADEASEVSINVPAGAQTGDLLILTISGGAAPTNTVDTPDGWTPIADQEDAGEEGHVVLRAFYRIRENGDASSVDCSISGFGVDNILANMLCYEGGTFDAEDPIDGTPTTNAGQTEPAVGLSVTTTEDSAVLVLTGLAREATVYTTPDGMTLRAENELMSCRAWDEEIETAGATGDRESADVTTPWVNTMFAIKPAASA